MFAEQLFIYVLVSVIYYLLLPGRLYQFTTITFTPVDSRWALFIRDFVAYCTFLKSTTNKTFYPLFVSKNACNTLCKKADDKLLSFFHTLPLQTCLGCFSTFSTKKNKNFYFFLTIF